MNFFDENKKKINKKINPENLILIDNSSLHTQNINLMIQIKFILKL